MVFESEGDINPKKKVRKTERDFNSAILDLRISQLGVTDPDDYTIGMIFDMLTEQANDQEEYAIVATQEDIDAFFGG